MDALYSVSKEYKRQTLGNIAYLQKNSVISKNKGSAP